MENGICDVALLIPVYNGESAIFEVIAGCRMLKLPIIVIDDGSTDGTADRVKQAQVEHFCRHERNQGKGKALQTGFEIARAAGYRTVISFDGDGQHQPEEIPAFLERYRQGKADIIIGNRFLDLQYRKQMPLIRLLSNWFSSAMIRWVAGLTVQDIQCGLRLYRLAAIEPLKSASAGFEFETEILLEAAEAGLILESVPIRCIYPDGTASSRFSALKDSWKIAQVVYQYWYLERRSANRKRLK